jgi:hypothetical protein
MISEARTDSASGTSKPPDPELCTSPTLRAAGRLTTRTMIQIATTARLRRLMTFPRRRKAATPGSRAEGALSEG